ncbi:MAG: lipase family protein [Roseiarcus sp.]
MLIHHDLALIAGQVYRGPWSGLTALDVRYDLLPRADELVVAVPGTDPTNALDIIRDARAWPSWIPGIGMMHSGFGQGGAALWAKIDPLMRRDGLITYVGHSLGAAMAEVAAAHHAIHRPAQPFRTIVFGCPGLAWLNPYFRRLLLRGLEAVEYRNAGDPVVAVPGRVLGYLHGAAGPTLATALPDPLANHAVALYAARVVN